MRRVAFKPEALTGPEAAWFASWKSRSRRASDKLKAAVAADEEPQFRQAVWADLKKWLLEHVFHGKCAYCEGRMLAQSYGAAEHYRPKSRVTSPIGREAGYAWLAYDWRNIIPACDQCNSGDGKQDQFPIAGRRVHAADELVDPDDIAELNAVEEPLLLHPYTDHPEEHLIFGHAGAVGPRNASPKGRETISVCRLDRAALMDERARVQEQVRSQVALAFLDAGRGERSLTEALDRVRKQYSDEYAEYSVACRQALLDAVKALAEQATRYVDP
ncbi:hypothetical protein ACQP00_45485 [Dactylosporangium sp. CS-047395]|uniref:hypothetical protein n=1 Tax=Dactylosporangium sp. CS-047395 TaxID=3239936 RepID=UPI003D8DDBBB